MLHFCFWTWKTQEKPKTKQSNLLFPSCQWAGLLLYSSLPNPYQQVKILIATLSWLAIPCTVSGFSLAICHEAQYCCEVPGEMVPCVPSIQKVLSFLHPFPCCKPGIHSPTAPQPNSRPYRPLSYNACPTCHFLCSSVLSSGAGGATPTRGIEGKSCDTYLNLL